MDRRPLVRLENESLKVEIAPAVGARIVSFFHKRSGTEFLWHNPEVPLKPLPIGADYDDNFWGGWDELFPNDAPTELDGRQLPDHGELWSQSWEHSLTEGPAPELYLRLRGPVTGASFERWVTLDATRPVLRVKYRLVNTGDRELRFLWKLHPALRIAGGDRIEIPAGRARAVDPAFGRRASAAEFEWPGGATAGGIDFSVLPSPRGERDFLYVYGLRDGWCALRRTQRNVGFGIAFPREIFSSVWLFMTYGGWRGLHTLVLEPCTTMPKDLHQAIASGSAARLAPLASLECEVAIVAFTGSAPIRTIRPDGDVKFAD